MKLFTQRHLRSFKSCCFNRSSGAGFTLVELLIVIAILGILAAGIVVVINPLEKINSANMAKAETFAAGIRNSLAMNLVGEWTFDDGTAKDTSGYGNDGDVNGAIPAADRNGQANKAYSFDGVDDRVIVPNSPSLNFGSGSFSIEFWINRLGDWSVGHAYNHLFQKKYTHLEASGDGWGIMKSGGTGLTFFLKVFSPYALFWGPAVNVPQDVFTHIAYTVKRIGSAITVKVYSNGILSGTTTGTVSGGVDNEQNFYIGAEWGNITATRILDDVRIYNKALLSYQIQQLYARGLVKHLLALK